MDGQEAAILQARFRKAQRWLRVTIVGWILSVAILILGWLVSVAVFSAGLTLFSAVFSAVLALP